MPDSLSLSDLLEFFLDKRQHLAIVLDEYGGTRGLVTLEDVVETLFGMEIMDEMDNVADMQALARQQWEKGRVRLAFSVNRGERMRKLKKSRVLDAHMQRRKCAHE